MSADGQHQVATTEAHQPSNDQPLNESVAGSLPDGVVAEAGTASADKQSKGSAGARGKKGQGKGRAKAKAKTSAKAKAKAKGRAKAKSQSKQAETAGNAGTSEGKPAKAKPVSMKDRILAQVGDRDVQDVIAETRSEIEALESEVKAAKENEMSFVDAVAAAQSELEEYGRKVEEAGKLEAQAVEELRAAKAAVVDAQAEVQAAQMTLGDVEKETALLELQLECKAKLQFVEEAKAASMQAAEAAQKALEDAKAKEREAKEAAKTVSSEMRGREEEALKAIHERQLALYRGSGAGKAPGKGSNMAAEMKELEKRRQERSKKRAQQVALASGCPTRGSKASVPVTIEDEAAPAEMPAAKAPRTEDLDLASGGC